MRRFAQKGTRDGDPIGRRRIGQGPRVAPALLPFLRGGVAMAVLQPLIAMIGRAAAVNREPQLSAHTEEHTMTPSAAQYPSSRPQPAAVATLNASYAAFRQIYPATKAIFASR